MGGYPKPIQNATAMNLRAFVGRHSNTLSFLRYIIRGHKWGLMLIIIIGLGSVGASLLFVWFSKCIIDIATWHRPGRWWYYALGLVLSMGAQAGLRLLNGYMRNRVAIRMGNNVQLRLFSHLLYTRWQSLGQVHSGDMLTRMMKDTDEVIILFLEAIPTMITALSLLAGALFMLYIYSPMLALILGVGMPFAAFFSKFYYKRMLGYSREIKQTESRITSRMQEVLTNQTIIRTFERQDDEINHLRYIQGELYGAVNKRLRISAFANMMISASFSGGYLVAFLWSAYGLRMGTITFGTMTSFLQLVMRIQRPLLDLIGVLPKLVSAKASVDRLVSVLEYKTESRRRSTELDGELSLVLSDIHFRYDADTPWIIEGLSLSVRSGQMLAIMGRTGAGKTTLIRLLLALVEAQQGKLYIEQDGKQHPLSEATRSNFVYVPQGNSLFSGTVRDNLLLGDPQASDAKLAEVLRIAMAEFVYDLPKGLDTMLSEQGAGLSQGQQQRLSIARSLLRPGSILLFDEATSALDAETEELLMRRLKEHLGQRIVLFITHTAAVAEHCDDILRL